MAVRYIRRCIAPALGIYIIFVLLFFTWTALQRGEDIGSSIQEFYMRPDENGMNMRDKTMKKLKQGEDWTSGDVPKRESKVRIDIEEYKNDNDSPVDEHDRNGGPNYYYGENAEAAEVEEEHNLEDDKSKMNKDTENEKNSQEDANDSFRRQESLRDQHNIGTEKSRHDEQPEVVESLNRKVARQFTSFQNSNLRSEPESFNSYEPIGNKKQSIQGDDPAFNFTSSEYRVDANPVLLRGNSDFMLIAPAVYLYSAFYDDRKQQRYIRLIIIAWSGRQPKLWCHFHTGSGQKTSATEASFYETCENHLKTYSAFLASCSIPDSVSFEEIAGSHFLISDSSDLQSSQNHKIKIVNTVHEETYHSDFSVCAPPLFGDINVLRLTEFIEFNRLLGANHFTFYLHHVSKEVRELLQFYERIRIVTLLPWNIPVHSIWYYGQSVAIWDCLYRNMFHFRKVTFQDIDEFFIPHIGNTWSELLTYLQEDKDAVDKEIAAYRFKSAFFDQTKSEELDQKNPDVLKYEDIRKEMKMFSSISITHRTMQFSNIRTKLIVDPVKVFEIGIHHVSKPMEEHFKTYDVNPLLGYVHHYRPCETNFNMNCELYVHDSTTWKYRYSLLEAVKDTLNQIKGTKSSNSSLIKAVQETFDDLYI